MNDSGRIVRRLPLISLLGANAIPLFGVLFFRWDAFGIILLYWSENVAVGFYNVLKIALVKVRDPKENLGKLFMIPFFMIHFGGFTGIHGVFVLTMFGQSDGDFMHRTNPGRLMAAPYGRVVVMHVAIIAGGFILVVLKSPVALLLVLVVLKTFMDVKLHFYEHREKGAVKVG